MARTTSRNKGMMTSFGSSGLKHYGGILYEENLAKLSGTNGNKVYMEMRDNDSTIGAILFAIDKLLRSSKWRVEPASQDPKAQEIATFVDSCRMDMDHTWEDFISEVLSMLVFGYSVLEMVFKFRMGPDNPSKAYRSAYNDSLMGWRKLPLRAQETIYRWVFNDDEEVTAVEQQPLSGPLNTIPAEKLLMFRTQSYKNSPQGRSILRNAYRAYFFKKRIEEIEGVGIERDLAGLPVAKVPANLLLASATVEEKATLAAIKKMIVNIRRDEQEGVVFPLVYDEAGNELYKLELLSTGGTRQFDTNKIIDRYDKRIAMTVLADFIFLGQSKVGSFALSSDKTDMFSVAIGAWLFDIASVLNRKALPLLMEVNNIPRELWPTFVPGDLEKQDIAKFADVVYKLVGVGALQPDDDLDAKIRSLLELPVKTSDGNK